ncbi:MAG: LEA type 2 family protein [Vicinamibacteria bacterium]|nr:LEA type 2 family protein [Vicinamibacteria bacterium]
MKSLKTGMRRIAGMGCLWVAAAAMLGGCATLKPPQLFVEGLKVDKLHVTGVSMDVRFRIHNTNPEPLEIENLEYQLDLNGVRLGRGYYGEPVPLRGFAEAVIVSRFHLNMLNLPAGVQEVLSSDRARARVRGTFHAKKDGGLRKLRFSTEAEVDLRN